jgi:transglutaminase/protease-like cytokinesis protein 3
MWQRDLEWMQKFIEQETGIKPSDASSRSSYPTPPSSNGSSPPPVPMGSHPSLAQLNKAKPTVAAATAPATDVCLKCRDFSGPDNHAARFPRQSIPNQDPKWLGQQLCNPFPSHTDKARAIFTWLHHNIDYNVEAFFSGNLKPSTPTSTIATGLAVCEGYAGLFTALATAAGLESVVVGGHGKGAHTLPH